MSARTIVRDPTVLDGRWHFAGTTIAVAEVRAVLASTQSVPATMRTFQRAGLSDAEVQAAQEFMFPEVRALTTTVDLLSMTVHCVCGEDTPGTTLGAGTTVIACPCNRRWRVTIEAEPDAR
jgi:hypothetical protein